MPGRGFFATFRAPRATSIPEASIFLPRSTLCLTLLLALVADPAAAASVLSAATASEPGTLVLALGGLAALQLAQRQRRRPVVFPLFERDSR